MTTASRRDHKDSLLKMEMYEWIEDTQTKLKDQIETFDAELENTSANKKSKTKSLRDKFEKLQSTVVRHHWHCDQLDLLAKSLRNDRVTVSQVHCVLCVCVCVCVCACVCVCV